MEKTRRNTQENAMKVIRYLSECADSNHYVPTVRDISQEVHLAPSTVHKYLRLMEDDGYVSSTPGKSRSTYVTKKGKALIRSAAQ